jgi:hypothetical protein
MAARIKLGELLVRAGVLDEFKLKAALAEQQRWGGRLGKILVEMNFVTEDLLVRALSKQLGIPRARFEGGVSIPTDILSKIDPTFCSNNAICPERYIPDRKVLVVAMADPTNVSAVDELRFKTGMRIETSLAGELEVSLAIDRLLYGREPVDGIELSGGNSVARSSVPMNPAASSMPTGQLFDHLPFNGHTVSPPLPVPNNHDLPVTGEVWGLPAGYAPSDPRLRSPPPPLAPARSMPPPLPGPAYSQMPPLTTGPIPQPSLSQLGFQTQMGPMSQPTPPPTGPGNRSAALDMAVALDVAQRKQLKAIRVMLELLIEKGIISRDEYIQLVNKR